MFIFIPLYVHAAATVRHQIQTKEHYACLINSNLQYQPALMLLVLVLRSLGMSF